MATNTIFASPRFDVEVTRSSDAFGYRYTVRYGLEFKVYSTVSAALEEFKECIHHARECEGGDLELEDIWAQSSEPQHGDDGSDCGGDTIDDDYGVLGWVGVQSTVSIEAAQLKVKSRLLAKQGYTVTVHADRNIWRVMRRGRSISQDTYRSYAEAVSAAYEHFNGLCRC